VYKSWLLLLLPLSKSLLKIHTHSPAAAAAMILVFLALQKEGGTLQAQKEKVGWINIYSIVSTRQEIYDFFLSEPALGASQRSCEI